MYGIIVDGYQQLQNSYIIQSVPYCSKYLKNVFGCTFSAMIQKIRFQNAECLLRNSDMTVSEVGKEIGYENTENFFRVFKKHYHMTPSQYRAAIQEENNMQTVCGDRDVIKR